MSITKGMSEESIKRLFNHFIACYGINKSDYKVIKNKETDIAILFNADKRVELVRNFNRIMKKRVKWGAFEVKVSDLLKFIGVSRISISELNHVKQAKEAELVSYNLILYATLKDRVLRDKLYNKLSRRNEHEQ